MLYDNHQVLALESLPKAAGVSKLRIYDSNHPGNDTVTIESRPAVVGSITFPGPLAMRLPLVGIKSELVAAPSPARPRGVRIPVRGIFQMPYTPATPPADQALTR